MIKPKKAIEELKAYSPPLEGRRGSLRLDFNENTIGCSPMVLKAIKNLTREDISTYPEYYQLSGKLAKYANVNTDQIMITNGSNEAIKIIFEGYIEKGDEVILPVPTFTVFSLCASIAGANIKKIMYDDDFGFPTEKVIGAISQKTKMVILVNPNNPTGTKIERKDIIEIIKKAKNSIVLLDEAYFQFINETCIDLVNKYENLIVIQTFSKAFGMAGLRFGIAVSNKENVSNLLKARLPYSVNAIAVRAAMAAIDDTKYTKKYVKEINQSKKILYNELDKLKIKTYPSAANFLVAYFGEKSKEIQDKLRKKRILVRDQSSQPLMNGYIRITVGTKKQTFQLVNSLKGIIK